MTTPRSTLNSLRLTFALLLLGLGGVSLAQNQLFTPPASGFTWRDNANEANGAYFTTTATGTGPGGGVVVSHLGYFSTNTVTGLARDHYVGICAGNLTTPTVLRQVDVPAGKTAYYYNNFYWVQLDPPLLLSPNTAYILGAQGYNLEGDFWQDATTGTAPTWATYFIGTQGTATRYGVYGPTSTTWPATGYTKNGNNKAYVMGMLGNLPNGPAKVGYTGPTSLGVTGLQSFTLSAFSSGATPITYQWWQNGTAIPGATTQTLTVPSAWDTNSGTYYFTATNSLDGQQSANISVVVYTGATNLVVTPTTYGQTETLFAGANANFAVTGVSGVSPFAYQWYTNGTADSTATSTTYSLANVQASTPSTIACVVTNLYGSATNTWTISVVAQPTASYPATILADNPMGYWRLNEADNNAGNGNFDAVANDYWGGNSGVYSNTVLNQTGYGQGLAGQYGYTPATDTENSALFRNYPSGTTLNSYAGNINGVNFSTATNHSAAFSIEAWVTGAPTEIAGAALATKGTGNGGEQFNLDVYNNAFRFFIRDAGGVVHGPTSTFLVDGNWHHVVGVVDEYNSNIVLYVDGQLRASSACSPSNGVLSSSQPVTIGARRSSSTSQYDLPFAGNINDVAIYNFALSSNQVFNHYAAAGIGAHFTQKPVAATNVNQGTDLIVAAAVIGTPPVSCQWYDVTGGSPGTPLANQTNATLIISNIQAAAFNGHTLALTTSNFYAQATSQLAVTVYSVPFFTLQPPPGITLYAGAAANFSVATVGPQPIGYNWLSNGVPIPSATSASLSLNNLQVSALYSCWASNYIGSSTSSVVSVTILPAPSAAYPVAVLADHPLGYWRLNETDNGTGNNGVLANDYWGGNYGIYSNTILGQVGYSQALSNQFGYYPAIDPNESSAQFGYYPGANARSNYVGNIPNITFATPTNTSGNFSVEAWANGDVNQDASGVNGAGIVAKGAWANEQFTLDTGGPTYAYRFTTRDAGNVIRTANTSTNLPDGTWHHLVGVLDETHSNLCLYVDGIKVATTSCSPSNGVLSSSVPVSIGSRLSSGGAYGQQFFGNINDVALYNYALSSTQVVAHYLAAGIGPRITLQPVSITNVNEGTALSVPVQALGSPSLSYQWYDVTFGSPGTALAGQTGPTLVINNISEAAYNGHIFSLTVTNVYGQTTSSTILVYVAAGAPNTVTITPPYPPTMYAGLPITFTATAQGSQPFGYLWELDGNPVGDSSSTYTYYNLTGSHTLACTVTNSVGNAGMSVSPSGVAAPSDTYGMAIVNDQPLALLRLDEAAYAGTAYDYVGGHDAFYYNVVNGLTGFSPAAPAETATGFGMNGLTSSSMALEYDQSGSGVASIDFSTQGANAHFSLEAWVNAPAGQPSGAGILAKGYGNGGEQFSLDAYTGVFRFYVHNAANNATRTAQSPNIGPDGTWHHLVAVCDEANGAVRLYIDGALNASGSMVPGEGVLGPLPLGSPIYTSIGSRMKNSSDSAYSFQLSNAVVAQVALYNYVLSPGQVANHYLAAAEPPSVYLQPSPASFKHYEGPPLQYSAAASGAAPLAYQWRKDGVPISAATTTLLSFPSLAPADSASYDLVVTNTYGATTSSVANLTVLGASTAYEGQVLAYNALNYWRFSETNGTTAYDYIGGLNGTYGSSTTNGFPGPSDPPFFGFESNNLAVAMDHTASGATGYATAPALNLNTNTLTLTCWVYPFGDITNYQSVVYSRASTYSKGITYIGLGTSRFNTVGYTWNQNNVNTYGWPSGLVTPPGQWSFVALTIAPSRAIMYVGANGALLAATNAIAHDVEAFNGTTLFGADTVANDRTFMGAMDEVAVYGSTLSGAQIANLYLAATVPPIVNLTIGRSGSNLILGWPAGTLLAAPSVNGPWTNVPNAAPPSYTVSPTAQQLFYRVLVH